MSSFSLITSVCFLITLVCCSKALLNGEYQNLFNAAAFSNKSFSDKTSLPVKNSYLLPFPNEKAEILAVFLSKLYWTLFCSILLLAVLIFLLILIYNEIFLSRNELSDDKVILLTKIEYGSLVYSLYSFIKSLKSMSDEWLDGICWSSLLVWILMIK